MASPVGHASVGLAAAAVVARMTGTPPSFSLWFGAFIASGVPDLDVFLGVFGLRGPRYHRNASHGLPALGAGVVLLWLLPGLPPSNLDPGVYWAWIAALFSHPILDVLTTGPRAGARGYGIALAWPLSRKRWFLLKPILETADFGACRSVGDVLLGVLPEMTRLVPVSALLFGLAVLA
ncbi:MAG: metal-dependent hydrolase [Gemmatimonadetes bacterium]|nr:metal-dependent hydrolase [Gemmatimonadota bacterium]